MKILITLIISAAIFWSCSSGNKNNGQTAAAESETTSATESPSQDSSNIIEQPVSSSSAIDSLHFGMKESEVIAVLGEPTKKETVSKDPKVVVEDWWYGENQKVRMVKGEVNNVVKDVAHQKELLMQLMQAKKNKDEAEAKRIMDELAKDHR